MAGFLGIIAVASHQSVMTSSSRQLSDSESERPPLRRQKCQKDFDPVLSDSEGEDQTSPVSTIHPYTFDLMNGVMGRKEPLRFAEVFSGEGALSTEFQRRGFHSLAIDYTRGGILHDISNDEVVESLKNKLLMYHYVHFAPPCNTFSNARFPKLRPGVNL